jgi:hypothetical protein
LRARREIEASFENSLRFQNSRLDFLGGRFDVLERSGEQGEAPRLAEKPLRLNSYLYS